MNRPPRLIHCWFPGLFSFKGGLQRYCEQLLFSLAERLEDTQIDVYLKNTSLKDVSTSHDRIRFSCTGGYSGKRRTLLYTGKILLNSLWQKPDWTIVGHVRFSVVALFLRIITRRRYIVLTYGLECWKLSSLQQLALRHAEQIVTISPFTEAKLLDQLPELDEKLIIIPCTVDSDRFRPGNPHVLTQRFENKGPILLTVCRMDQQQKHKGYDLVLESLVSLREEYPEILYLLIGEGTDMPRVQSLVKRLGVDEQVELIGPASDEELPDYYRLSDIFVMPSRAEGFGIAYLEALASGKPVISGDSDGSGIVVEDGVNGYRVDPTSSSQLIERVTQTLKGGESLFDPVALRKSVIRKFGMERFRENVRPLVIQLSR